VPEAPRGLKTRLAAAPQVEDSQPRSTARELLRASASVNGWPMPRASNLRFEAGLGSPMSGAMAEIPSEAACGRGCAQTPRGVGQLGPRATSAAHLQCRPRMSGSTGNWPLKPAQSGRRFWCA